jgi:hypothetical protein
MGNNMFRECCSSNSDLEHINSFSDLEHINSFSDDGNYHIDYYVDTRGHIYDMNVNVLKTTPGPPILFK